MALPTGTDRCSGTLAVFYITTDASQLSFRDQWTDLRVAIKAAANPDGARAFGNACHDAAPMSAVRVDLPNGQ